MYQQTAFRFSIWYVSFNHDGSIKTSHGTTIRTSSSAIFILFIYLYIDVFVASLRLATVLDVHTISRYVHVYVGLVLLFQWKLWRLSCYFYYEQHLQPIHATFSRETVIVIVEMKMNHYVYHVRCIVTVLDVCVSSDISTHIYNLP